MKSLAIHAPRQTRRPRLGRLAGVLENGRRTCSGGARLSDRRDSVHGRLLRKFGAKAAPLRWSIRLPNRHRRCRTLCPFPLAASGIWGPATHSEWRPKSRSWGQLGRGEAAIEPVLLGPSIKCMSAAVPIGTARPAQLGGLRFNFEGPGVCEPHHPRQCGLRCVALLFRGKGAPASAPPAVR
jgi:hypothetical protein